MSTPVLNEPVKLTHAGLAAGACRRAGSTARHGRVDVGGSKRAFARRRVCSDRRRTIEAGNPQVGSGAEPGSGQGGVGSSSFYDPSTGQFISRDPAVAATRSAYGYVYGNPLNNTDPSGLYCITGVANPNRAEGEEEICNGASEVANNVYHPVRAAVTAPQSAVGLATNLGAGADCRWNSAEWVTVCYGGRTILNAPASTIGGVINTRLTPEQFARANDGRLLAHEVKHTDQWLIFGWMFPSLDAEAAAYDWLVSKVTGCPEGTNNIFEVWAGLKDGGYTR